MCLGEMMIIKSNRLILKALTLDELLQLQENRKIDSPYKQDRLEFGALFIKAIGLKINKMKIDTDHHWLTYWMIIDAESNEAMGFVGFKGLVNNTAEIGYGISKCFEGKGFMSEAVECLVKWAFENGCETITATRVLKDNYGSQKVLEKNHFVLIDDNDTKSYVLKRK
jgi:RimJ/RimL family protein N-acetyltransferase